VDRLSTQRPQRYENVAPFLLSPNGVEGELSEVVSQGEAYRYPFVADRIDGGIHRVA
jgi:hypothetical protein